MTAESDRTGLREPPVAAVVRNGGATIVRLVGELDLYNAQAVRESLRRCCDERPERLIVDLSGVDFCDSTALGVLVEARRLFGNGDAFLLAGPGLEMRRALSVSGLDRHFAVHDSVEDALAAPL